MPFASANDAVAGVVMSGARPSSGAMWFATTSEPPFPVSSSIHAVPSAVGTAASTLSAAPSASRTMRIGSTRSPRTRSVALAGVSTTIARRGSIVSMRPANRSSPRMPSIGGTGPPNSAMTSMTVSTGAVNGAPASTTGTSSQCGLPRRSPLIRKPVMRPHGLQPIAVANAGVMAETPSPVSNMNVPSWPAIVACTAACARKYGASGMVSGASDAAGAGGGIPLSSATAAARSVRFTARSYAVRGRPSCPYLIANARRKRPGDIPSRSENAFVKWL